jgi:HK97 family phage major capsid protein
MDKQEELKGKLIEMGFINKEAHDQAVVEYKEDVTKMKEENTELKTKIEALENAPAVKVSLPVPGRKVKADFIYKGRDVRTQGKILTMADNDMKEEVAKMFIDFVERALNGEKAAMNETTTTQGGYTVFDDYISNLLALARLSSVALQDAMVIQVGTDTIRWPKENTKFSGAWVDEAASIDAVDPTFTELVLQPKKYASYTTASNELLADTEFDIVSMLTSQWGESVGLEIDRQTFDTDATIFTPLPDAVGINEVETLTNTIAGLSDWRVTSNAIAQLSANKIGGATWYTHRSFFHYLRIMKDEGSNGLYDPNTGSPAGPGELWGYPVRLPENFATDSTATSPVVIFGNLKNYVIAERKGAISIDVDPYGRFLNDQTRFRATVRYHGLPLHADAFCQINV